MNRNNLEKIYSIILILGPIYFILTEFITILHTNVSTIVAYTSHTVSELGVPIGSIYKGVLSSYSPMSMLMNCTFVISGLVIFISNLYIQKYISKENKNFVNLLALIASIGVIIVGLFHATDTPIDMHIIGSVMIILCGNLYLLAISNSVTIDKYKKPSRYLGTFGLIACVILLIFRFSYLHDFQAIFERCAIYPLILWCFILGLFSFKDSF